MGNFSLNTEKMLKAFLKDFCNAQTVLTFQNVHKSSRDVWEEFWKERVEKKMCRFCLRPLIPENFQDQCLFSQEAWTRNIVHFKCYRCFLPNSRGIVFLIFVFGKTRGNAIEYREHLGIK